MTSKPDDPQLCRIEEELGHREHCPADRCAFWEPSRGANPGGCVFHAVDFAGRDNLAQWLHDLRDRLEAAAPGPGGRGGA